MRVALLPSDRPRRNRVHRDQARRQTRQSLEPGYPRRSNHPGIQETTSTARDPPPRLPLDEVLHRDHPPKIASQAYHAQRFHTAWTETRRWLDPAEGRVAPR